MPSLTKVFCPRIEFLKSKDRDREKALVTYIQCTASRTSKLLHTSALSSVQREGHVGIYTLSQVLAILGTLFLFPIFSLLRQAKKRAGASLKS